MATCKRCIELEWLHKFCSEAHQATILRLVQEQEKNEVLRVEIAQLKAALSALKKDEFA